MQKILRIAFLVSLVSLILMPAGASAAREEPPAPGEEAGQPGRDLAKDRFDKLLDQAEKLYKEGDYYPALKAAGRALTVKPNDPDALYLSGLASLKLGLVAKAVEGLTLSVRMDPENRDARLKLASLLLASGNPKAAGEHLEKLAANYPDDPEVLVLSSKYHLLRKDLNSAQKTAEKALELAPRSGEALVNMAAAYLQKEMVSEAEQMADRAARLKTLDADARVALGKYFLKRGKLEEAEAQFERAKSTDPNNPIPYLTLGELKIIQGRLDETERLYRQAVSINEKAAGPRMRLAELLSGRGKMKQALQQLDTLVKYYPNNVEILSLKGRVYLRKGDNKSAAELFGKLVRKMPGSPDMHYQHARALFRLGRLKEMKTAVKKALELNDDMHNARVLLAGALLLEGKVDEAQGEALKVAQEQPQNPYAFSILGDVALAKKNYNSAARNYRKVLEITPRNPKTHLSLGRVYALSGKVGEAEKEFRLALKHDPGEYEALSHLVELMLSNQRAEEAESYLQERLERGEDPIVYRLLARTYGAQERPDMLEKSLRKAIELKPDYTAAHVELALFLKGRGRTAEAIRHLGALESEGMGNPRTTFTYAQLLMEDQQYKRAASKFEDYLESRPRDPVAANNLVWIYTEHLKDLTKARRAADKYLKNWGGPEIKDTLGWLSYREGDLVEAERLLSESADALSGNPRVIYHLAVTKYELGKVEEAKDLLKAALDTKGEFPEAAKAERLLKKL